MNVSGGTLNAAALNADNTVNQSGGTVNTTLDVGAGGNYNLTGGTLNSATAADVTIDGTLTIDGGMLYQDLNSASDTVEITGSGELVLLDGLLQTENGAATSVVNLEAQLTILGGELDLSGQTRAYSNIKVVGDEAVINIDRLGANRTAASFTFELGENGVSTIESSGGYQTFANGDAGASLLIDGANYVHAGGTFTNLLFDSGNLVTMFDVDNVTITNFADGLTVNFFQDDSYGADWVGIEIIPEPAAVGLIVIFGGGMLFAKRRFNF